MRYDKTPKQGKYNWLFEQQLFRECPLFTVYQFFNTVRKTKYFAGHGEMTFLLSAQHF